MTTFKCSLESAAFEIPVTSWIAAPSLAEESQGVNLYIENINRE